VPLNHPLLMILRHFLSCMQKELTQVPPYGKVKISNICRTVRRGSFPEKITEENEGKSVDNLENL